MYVHIGEDVLIRTSDIIAILDKQSVDLNKIRQKENLEQSSAHLTDKNVKSVVITTEKIFLSSIASTTLKKKTQFSSLKELSNDQFTNFTNKS